MSRALKLDMTIVLVGVLLTVLASMLSFFMESRSLVKQEQLLAFSNLERTQQSFAVLGGRIDAAIAFLNRGMAPWQSRDFGAFMRLSEKPTAQQSDWMIALVVPQDRRDQALETLRRETGLNTLVLRGAAAGGKHLAAVSYALLPEHQAQLGFDLATITSMSTLIDKSLTSSAPLFGILPPERKLGFWDEGAIVVAKSVEPSLAAGQDYTQRHLLVRVISTQELRTTLAMDRDESFLVRGQEVALGTSALLNNPRHVSLSAATPWPPGIDIALLPSTGRLPLSWLPVAIIGLLGTALAAFARAGAVLRSQTSAIEQTLRGTQTSLDQANALDDAFFNTSGTANCVFDANTKAFLRVNDRMTGLFGYTREEFLSGSHGPLTIVDDDLLTASRINTLGENGVNVVQFEKRYLHKDGHTLFCLLNVRSLKTAEGGHRLLAATVLDISDRIEQEKLRNALTMELAHRLRNSVQLTTVIARQTAKNADTVQEYETKFQQRLQALKVAQDLLFESEWRAAPLDAIFRSILAPFADSGRTSAVVNIDVPPLKLPPQHAQTLALAMHELAVNSFEHGALAHGGGVAVIGTIEGTTKLEVLHLKWVERSSRPPDRMGKNGFGMRMLTGALPDQFGGTAAINWTSKGLIYEAHLPLPKVDA